MKHLVSCYLLLCLLAACRPSPGPVARLNTNNLGAQPMQRWTDSTFTRKYRDDKHYREGNLRLTYFQDSIRGIAVGFFDRIHHHYAVDSDYRATPPVGWKKIGPQVRNYETMIYIHNEGYPLHLQPFKEYPADLHITMLASFRHRSRYYLLLEMHYFFTWGDDFGSNNEFQLVVELDKSGHLVRTKEFDKKKWGYSLDEIKKRLDQ